MKRIVGIARIVVAGMILMSGAFGMFGDIKVAAVNHVFPRIPRTEQEQMARLQKDGTAPAVERGLSIVARGRSGEADPCVPLAPITFSPRGPVVC
jgi:hypothetical protein